MLMRRAAPLAIAMVCSIGLSMTKAQERGDPAAGLDYALQHCATCHAIRKGHSLSPRPDAPGFENIANTSGITGISLAAALHSVHENMPNFILPLKERDDMIAYILTLKRGN